MKNFQTITARLLIILGFGLSATSGFAGIPEISNMSYFNEADDRHSPVHPDEEHEEAIDDMEEGKDHPHWCDYHGECLPD